MRRWTWVWVLTAFCSVLMIAVAGLVIALVATSSANDAGVQAKAAAAKAQRTIDCVDRLLAARASTTERDANAHVAFAQAVNALFTPAKGQTPEQQAEKFRRQVLVYATTLAADQAYRNAHPLGLC